MPWRWGPRCYASARTRSPVARQPHPDPHGRDHLERRVERMHGDVEADLVVALAGAAVGDRFGTFLVGHLDEELGDQRPRQAVASG